MATAPKHAFHGAGNAFSRVLFVLENGQDEAKTVYVVPGEDEAAAALRYFRALADAPAAKLETAADFYAYLAAPRGIWVATAEIFFKAVPTDREIAQRVAFVKPGDVLGRDALIGRLADAGYRFSRDGAPGTYRADGDTVTVWPNFGDRGWRVAFFDDAVEAVMSFPAQDELDLSQEKRLALPAQADVPAWEAADFSTDLCRHLADARVWLSGLDFFEELPRVQSSLARWTRLADVPDPSSVDLGVEEPRIPDLAALHKQLADLAATGGKRPVTERALFFTQRPDAVRRFLDDNRLPDFQVLPLLMPAKGTRRTKGFGARSTPLSGKAAGNKNGLADGGLGGFSRSEHPQRLGLSGLEGFGVSGSRSPSDAKDGPSSASGSVPFSREAGKAARPGSETGKSSGIPLRGQSFRAPDRLVLCDDLLGPLFVKARTRRAAAASADLLLQIRPGDHVVHLHHGVGVFERIVGKELGGVAREYLEIRYAADDKLFVPIEEADRLSKYVGRENPELHRLGGEQWKRALADAQEDAARVALELLEGRAKRRLARAPALVPRADKEAAFRAAFPYPHTADQESAAAEILADLEKDEPMDRLLSGDVGFGKTEVAMHAIYRAFLNGAQSVLLSPLLVLAHEHGDTLRRRLSPFGVRVETLSRLTPEKEEKRILKDAAAGKVDVLVGTHRLLSPDVAFPRLGLAVVDEEHRFGVQDKERVAALRQGVHALSMSATPIPRSLHLAMSGVRKMSVIATAPWGRLPVQTVIAAESDQTLADAVARELERGGQAFVLSNRVETMLPMRDRLARLLPKKARITVVHGQMGAQALEDAVLAFKRRESDVLLCSTVVENGVNFLDANTMVVLDADKFGLSQLHQLRGRVGRGKAQGYCHLLYRREKLTPEARRRLSTMAALTHLGAGFEIALRDLEIRGAGEMLGLNQSGKTKEVGVGLYLRLLEDKVREARGDAPRKGADCQIDAAVSWKVPDEFFDGDADKVHFFRTLESVADEAELDEAWDNLLSGRTAPPEADNLLLALRTKLRLSLMGVKKVSKSGGQWQFDFGGGAGTEGLRAFLKADRRGLCVLSENRARIPMRAFPDDRAMLEYWGGK